MLVLLPCSGIAAALVLDWMLDHNQGDMIHYQVAGICDLGQNPE